MMHNNVHGDWFCGPGSFFSSFHFGGIFHLLVWGIVLFLLFKSISLLISAGKGQATATNHGNPSLTILEKRYASGEIGQEEFLQKKRDLKG
ncbi:MAG: SHOCT domain-containing protein [Desulfuromonadales bacterium]|nr:SHOCT domain-containing protein [Desulfuromonadales bacterium]